MGIIAWLKSLGRPKVTTIDEPTRKVTEQALSLLLAQPGQSDSELTKALCQDGAPHTLAAPAVIFLPVAAMRLLYYNSGMDLPDLYMLINDDTGKRSAEFLSKTPAFVAAFEVLRATNNVDTVRKIAIRSAEMAALSKVATPDTNPKNLTFSPLLIADWKSQHLR